MKTSSQFILLGALVFCTDTSSGQVASSDLDLSTRCVGAPPQRVTVSSAAQWMQNPLDQKLLVTVTNLYAAKSDCLVLSIGPRTLKFYGAGLDDAGSYVPTNYPPVAVEASLRRSYAVNVTCPNSGPQSSPLFGISFDCAGQMVKNDFNYADDFVTMLTSPSADPVSAFLWNCFGTGAQFAITNLDTTDPQTYVRALIQTNLITQMNKIITGGSIYEAARFVNVQLASDTTNLMARTPQGQDLVLLNRLLLRDAYADTAYPLPLPSQCDNSGSAQILFSVQSPPELKVRARPAPIYTVMLNGDSSGDGVLNLLNPGNGIISATNCLLELVKDKFAHVSEADGCDDASKAPGQGSWLTMGPGCTEDTNRISLEWHVSLGRTFDGLAAGQIAFRQTELSPMTYTPYSLFYNAFLTNIIGEAVVVTTNIPVSYTTNTSWGFIVPNESVANVYALLYTIPTDDGPFPGTLFSDFPLTTGAEYSSSYEAVEDYAYNTVIPTGGTILFLGYTNLFTYPNWAGMYWGSKTAVTTNTDTQLRQIKTEQAFVDITAPDTNNTILSFYFPNQVATNQDQFGLFTNILSLPFVTWTIQNPNPGSSASLYVIEARNGTVSTQALVKASSSSGVTWTLTLGTGADQRVETRQVSLNSTSDLTNRTETDTITYYNSSTPAYQCQETYQQYPWGWELAQTSIPNIPANLVTTYEYYSYDPNNPEPYSYYGNGQLKQIVYPDGYWEKRVYEPIDDDPTTIGAGFVSSYGALSYVFYPYLDGRRGGATAPDQADPLTTIFTKYNYGFGSPVNERNMLQYDGILGKYLNGEQGDYTDPDDAGPEGPSIESASVTRYDNLTGYGQMSHDYSDAAAAGLSGHPWYLENRNGQPSTMYYYDSGIFNGTANVFTLDPSWHLYQVGLTNYPDYRQTIISLAPFASGDGYYSSLEGHPGTLCFLFPGKSKKSVRIFHGGNLAQTEEYIYASAGEVNDDDGCISYDDPQWALETKTRYYVDSLGRATNVVRIDGVTGYQRTVYSADYRGGSGTDGELVCWDQDEKGDLTCYNYDSLQRVQSRATKGYGAAVDTTVAFTFDADEHPLQQATTAGPLSENEYWTYDLAGRTIGHVCPNGIATSITYGSGGRIQTTNFPGNITIVNTRFLDRRSDSLSGNGVTYESYDYDVVGADNNSYTSNDNIMRQITYYGVPNGPRWRATGKDYVGENVWCEQPACAESGNSVWMRNYFQQGWLIGQANSGGSALTNYCYDVAGNMNCAQESVGPSQLDQYLGSELDSLQNSGVLSDNSRNTMSQTLAIQLNSVWYQATTNYSCLADEDGTMTITGIHLEQLNGFTGNVVEKALDFDADNNVTVTTTSYLRASNLVTVVTSEPFTSSLSATNVYQNGRIISSSSLSAGPTVYSYDPLGRTNLIQDSQRNLTLMAYDPVTGWMTGLTDPAGNTTTYTYYGPTEANSGKLKCQTAANGKKTYYSYTTQGQLWQTWGDVPYPAEYRYNEYGDLTNLITFRGSGGWTGASWPISGSGYNAGDNTYWSYDAASGALTNKTDAQGRSVTYTYDKTTGRLLTRSWARTVNGVAATVTNSYNGFGDLTEQDYNDGTPSVSLNNYNRAAQPREIVDGAGTCELTYDNASRLVSSAYTAGPLSGITVSNHFNPHFGRDALKVISTGGNQWALEDDYGYDSYGRLGSVSSGTCTATYGYVANSDLLETTAFRNNGNAVMTTTRTWNFGFQLASIANTVAGATAPVTSHAYTYDACNRRTEAKLEDGSAWEYGYNDRNELTGAHRYWYDSRPVSGQQFGYNYDNIGNRTWAQFGGDTNGNNLRTIMYQANSLNQYTSVTTPGNAEIAGAALATNGVTVNGGLADRHGEYFHREISVNNTNQPVWQAATVASGGATDYGGLVFPANSQALVYDADGNLTFDGVWNYQWDGENRLISMNMTNVANLPATNRLKVDFAYDFSGRRISKTVYQWNNNSFGTSPATQTLSVYDGWNLSASLSSDLQIQSSFTWGQDLSGWMDGLGGVGGLLTLNVNGTNHFVCYDANGNVTALINASEQALSARYEYSPFGKITRATGAIAFHNPFRFSTKYCDDDVSLIYYGSRYYSPATEKWISKDSSGERGGMNLYLLVANHPTISADSTGLAEHHVATLQLARSLPDGPGTDYLKKFTVHVPDPHYYDADHRAYNPAIRELFEDFLERNHVTEQQFSQSAELAEKFVQETMSQSGNSRIGGYLTARGVAYWGAKAVKAAAILGVAFGGIAAGYNAVAGGQDLAVQANTYKQDVMSGKDSAWVDLDAIDMAVSVQTMTGDYFVTMAVVDTLLTP